MAKRFRLLEGRFKTPAQYGRARRAAARGWLLPAVALPLLAGALALAQEEMLFPHASNVKDRLVRTINQEKVRIDVAMWQLTEREISAALLRAHQSGVLVRVIGDRASLFESDARSLAEFEYLARAGIPIRLRYNPRNFPEAMHWKAGIFAGQNVVEFGSANWTPFELRPVSATNYKDETALFTDDPRIVNAFKTMFDRMWVDQQAFLDWPVAYLRETGTAWTSPMTIPAGRLEPDHPTNLPEMVWSQGSSLIARMIAEIKAEPLDIRMVSYRMTSAELTDALIAKHQAGVRVRVITEPTQYRNGAFPEYWLVRATTDRLWAAGVPVKQRVHSGLTHMKTLITSAVALNGSSNFTRNWERDHNYFIPADSKPALYGAMRDRFEEMWNDASAFGAFKPEPPSTPVLSAPLNGATNVPTLGRLEWKRTPWAVAYDVYFGTDSRNLPLVGRVRAVLSETPPATYSYPPGGLAPLTRYYWRVVARTFAADLDASLLRPSSTFSFTTGDGSNNPVPSPPVPVPPPAPSRPCIADKPQPGMVCVDGAWVPRP